MSATRILVVEDESIIAEDLKDSLIKLGYTVPSVESTGEKAIKKTEEIKPRSCVNGYCASLVIHDFRVFQYYYRLKLEH